MEKVKRYQNQFFFILLGLSFVLSFLILKPFLTTLLVTVAFAVVLNPIHRHVARLFGKWRGIAAIVTMIGLLIVVVVPLTLIVSRVITESTSAYASLGSELSQPGNLIHRIEEPIQQIIPSFHINLEAVLRPVLQTLSDNAAKIFATTITTVINTVIFFIGLFFLLKNGNEIKRYLLEISPLPNEFDGVIVFRLESTINSVIRGSLFVAIIQGTLAGIGYAIFGVPNPTLLGLLTAIASLIPGLGTPIVTIPSALYLYFTGHPLNGIGMALWGLTAVGLIDNILGPKIIGMGRGVNIHPFLILISVLGGLAFFGPWGFLLGPIAISFLLALLDVFAEFLSGTVDEAATPSPRKSKLLAMMGRTPEKKRR